MAKHRNTLIPTRRSLLTRLKNWDDQEGWREFFDTYWNLIYGVALKAGLTDAEINQIAGRLDELPAGGVLGFVILVLVIVLLVFLILKVAK